MLGLRFWDQEILMLENVPFHLVAHSVNRNAAFWKIVYYRSDSAKFP